MTILVVVFLLALSAIFSGLTLGIMSLSPHDLKRKQMLGDINAAKLYPLRKEGNLLLVTLMFGNVAANSILSIFLGSILAGVVASIVSIVLISVLGGIVPQAVFSRYAEDLSSKFAPLANFFLKLFYPVCKPLAWLLDRILGEELPTIYSRKELLNILEEHAAHRDSDIQDDEERIARGALTFGDKLVKDVMTPRSMIHAIEQNTVLDAKAIDVLRKSGYSRVPVFDENPDRVKGILYLHVLADPRVLNKRVGEVCDRRVYFLNENEYLDHALNGFIKTKHHLYFVVNEFSEIVGLLAIEDVLEEILGREIVDEFDEYDDIRAVAKKSAKLRRPA